MYHIGVYYIEIYVIHIYIQREEYNAVILVTDQTTIMSICQVPILILGRLVGHCYQCPSLGSKE